MRRLIGNLIRKFGKKLQINTVVQNFAGERYCSPAQKKG